VNHADPERQANSTFRIQLGCAFGQALKRARLQAGHSQEKFAELAGFDRSFIGYMEAGKRTPGLLVILSLAMAAGLTPDELIRRTIIELQSVTDSAVYKAALLRQGLWRLTTARPLEPATHS
jgi:transcriptional regulator with XRE-family HTH domain